MATTTAMNQWTEELVASLVPANISPSKSRRLKAQFTRSVRHHNYARTNQFEVEERLVGLELRFQVLNHDDLSDALRKRRNELLKHQQQWVPDVLDFLLRMSKRPMAARGLESLNRAVENDLVSSQLTWADIEEDDPINDRDRIWRQPDYSDFSSDDDLIDSSAATSPESVKQKAPHRADGAPPPIWTHASIDHLNSSLNQLRFAAAAAAADSDPELILTEIQTVREMLFMLQGLPTTLFQTENGQLQRRPQIKISHMSSRALDSVLSKAINISKAASMVRQWSFSGPRAPFVENLEDSVASVIRTFDNFLSKCHVSVISAQTRGGSCSLMSVLEDVYQCSTPVVATAQFLKAGTDQDCIGLLDVGFELSRRAEQTGQASAFETLSFILCEALSIFVDPICWWVEDGILKEEDDSFFVEKVADQHDKAKLWHGWFSGSLQGRRRLPVFLAGLAERVFVAGKTAAFLRTLGHDRASHRGKIESLTKAIKTATTGTSSGVLPFGPSLVSTIEQYVDHHLAANTSSLQAALQQRCKMPETLSALSHVYLSESPYATSVIDAEIFTRLDGARPSWNDRFLVSDIIDEACCCNTASVDVGRIRVQSHPIPASQLLHQARVSVKILENLAIDYRLPWQIANIISADHIAAYRRISLLLTQIRRAKYVLERHGFLTLQKQVKRNASAETICTSLLLFVNVLHSHIMHCVVGPLTARMRTRLRGTVDEMISTHKSYTDAMERCCLLTKNLRMVRETLMSLLDLCVGFGFQVVEAKADVGVNDLAISKTRTQFRKLINLFVAGLRGAARAGSGGKQHATSGDTVNILDREVVGNVADLIDLLADSLESARFKM